MEDMTQEHPADCYLGDGVYVGCDGFGFVLDLRGQDTATKKTVIHLEPMVLAALNAYATRAAEFYAKKRSTLIEETD